MNKKIISDMIVSNKTIQRIPVSKDRRTKHESTPDKDVENIHTHKPVRPANWNRKPLNPKFVIWLIAFICLLALFFGLSIIFSSVTVTVVPKSQVITLKDDTYTAKRNSTNTTDLSFEILNVSATTSSIITATEEKNVDLKASGKIIIYNNYSSVPQRLINMTRFEANNGKIYRIDSSVTVPGLINVGGKVTPGSVEATVFADQAGDSYNMKLTDLSGDFKIPGFKGDVRYNGFYARLKTDITGGFSGKQKIISDNLRKTTEDGLKTKLKEQLLKELYAIKPDNYTFFNNSYSIDYSDLPDTNMDTGKAKISIRGDLNGIIFNNTKLSKYIATKKITDFDGLTTNLTPADNMTASFITNGNTSLWKSDTLNIKFNGDALIKWNYDAEALKKDLAGKKESDLNRLVAKYNGSLDSIKIIFRPVWTRYVPDNLNKIKIEEGII